MKKYEKKFKKGKVLDQSLDKFIMDCLMESVSVTRDKEASLHHDTVVKFKKDVTVKVTISYD